MSKNTSSLSPKFIIYYANAHKMTDAEAAEFLNKKHANIEFEFKKLKEARIKADVTLSEMAYHLNLAQSHYYRMEERMLDQSKYLHYLLQAEEFLQEKELQ